MAERTRVGLCGCGNMGSAIATQLAGNVDLVAFDLDQAKLAAVCEATGARAADSLADLVANSDHVVLSLPSPAASLGVITQLAPLLGGNTVVIETSTLNASDTHKMAAAGWVGSPRLVDAAILAGVQQMAQGKALLLVGGEDGIVAQVQDVLDAMSSRVVRTGGLGTGMSVKVANNAVSHAVMVVLVEATTMLAASGVSPRLFADLLAEPDAGLMRPLAHRLAERVFGGEYEGGMPVEAALKDSVLAHKFAEEHGVPLLAIRGAHVAYELSVAAGDSRLDYAAIAKLWETWAGVDLVEARP